MKFRSFFFCLTLLLFSIPTGLFAQDSVDPVLVVRDPEGFRAGRFQESPTGVIQMQPGEEKTIQFSWENRGKTTWSRVYAFTMEPRYHESIFAHSSWTDKSQTPQILNASGQAVQPGQRGILHLRIVAPDTPGTYRENFHLAQYNYTWIKHGNFWFDVEVTPATNVDGSREEPEEEREADGVEEERTEQEELTDGVSATGTAQLVSHNKKSLRGNGGQNLLLRLAYQHIGQEVWEDGYAIRVQVEDEDGRRSSLSHQRWVDAEIAKQSEDAVDPEEKIQEKFFITLPEKKGTYTATIDFLVGEDVMETARLSLPVYVSRDASKTFRRAFVLEEAVEPEEEIWTPRFAEEPRIRVGLRRLAENRDYIIFEPKEETYNVFDGEEKIGEVEAGVAVTLRERRKGGYRLVFPDGRDTLYADEYLRLEPQNDVHAVFELVGFNRTYAGKTYDTYRGAFEYRRTKRGTYLYAINDLLLEDYVKGIGENANKSNFEYLKAQTVAQRTYAYFTQQEGKYPGFYFDVVGNTGDQLYLGHFSEVSSRPRFARAAEETRGYMVTYDIDRDEETPNDIVTTPYFARTNGRTFAWTEVWGGRTKPWLVSVTADYDRRNKYTLYGHGVGMSQLDAVWRAEEEGLDWVALLTYYYTDVEVEKVYE